MAGDYGSQRIRNVAGLSARAADLQEQDVVVDTSYLEELILDLDADVVAHDANLTTHDTNLDGLLSVPSQDAIANAYEADVIGNKTDTASTTAAATDSVVSYLKGLLTLRGAKQIFASDIQGTVVLTSVVGDKTLPSVVVTLMTGLTIHRVYAAISWRKQVDSSAAGNSLVGAQQIQLRKDTPGAWVTCINLAAGTLATGASATEGGLMILGDNDLVCDVDVNDTYEFQWDQGDVTGDSLTFHDVQTYIIVEYV